MPNNILNHKSCFKAIFIYDRPQYCIKSIFDRKFYYVINHLSGEEIYKNKNEVDFDSFINKC